MGGVSRCFVVLAVVFTTAVFAQNDQASLEIQPNTAGKIIKEEGASLALTCRPNVRDSSLITQLEWRDHRDRRIDTVNRASPLYVQNLPGEAGSVLIFSRLTENLAGLYTCTAMYAASQRLVSNITVNTYVAITFVDAPESQYPIQGSDFKIKCKVQGNPAPVVAWNKNDNQIVSNDRYITEQDGLIIRNVRESDDGVYQCQAVVLSTGEINTRNIKVEVQVPPKIRPMKEISVVKGETASIKCLASGKPPPKYTWIKENSREDLKRTDRFDVKENTGDLIINRVESNDDSLYKCIAENPAGRKETTVKINVLVKPRIYELINITSQIGQETKIICKAEGRPPPKVTFRKLSSKIPFVSGQQKSDRRIILEQNFSVQKGESYATLIIMNLTRPDDGLYECIAENIADKAYKNGHITVEFPPTFARTKDLPSIWSWENNPGNLSCLPEAIPNATIIWKYNGIEINENSNNFVKIGNGPQSFLIVKPLHNRRFFTHYECIASNKLGSDSIKLELKEATVPKNVQQVRPQSITATTIKFNIVPPSYLDGLPIRTISVQYKPEREATWDYAANYTWSFEAPYILENLIPEVTYHFRFAAKNDVGMGGWTNAETITMPRRSEPAEPKILVSRETMSNENSSNRHDIVAISPYADHYELRWNIPNDNGDPITSYEIRYCVTTKINGEWRDSDCSEPIQQSREYNNYELYSLRPSTTYKIELRAHNAIGASSPAQIKVKTAQGIDPMLPVEGPTITSGAIIGAVVGLVLLVLIVVDIACFCVNRTGLLALMCSRSKNHDDEEDQKLGREERQPLREDEFSKTPITVQFDGNQVKSHPGEFNGKSTIV